jgi:tRNA-dihydrouridine synthase
VDKYYAPFIFPNRTGKIGKGAWLELAPEYNEGCPVVPQLLSNCADDVIMTVDTLAKMGYDEVNINLGCPSQTVVSKGRGAGFLREPDALREFLARIYDAVKIRVTVKTRIGMYDAEEFDELIDVYNSVPIPELTIHPRLRQDFYKGKPDMVTFEKALLRLKMPICYNGDIADVADYEHICINYPKVGSVMIGRGALSNPALFREISGGKKLQREELWLFHEAIMEGYEAIMGNNPKVISLMKEQWRYFREVLPEEEQQAVTDILHTNDRTDFLRKTRQLLKQ